DAPRWLHLFAYDIEAALGPLTVRGEVAYARIDVSPGLPELYARDQIGFFCEAVGTLFRRKLFMFQRASLAAVGRVDYVDLNLDRRATGEPIGDETWRLTAGLSFRPAPTTSLRAGYYREWITDPLNAAHTGGGLQIGIASYF